MSYKFLEHTADVKFRANGKTFGEMLVSAADALKETMRGEIPIIEKEEKEFEIDGEDRESLLYNFLEEFLFLLDAHDFLAARVEIVEADWESLKIKARVFGDSAQNYKFTNDVKAITFNEMYVRNAGGEFDCQVVLDV